MNNDNGLSAAFSDELSSGTYDQEVWSKALGYCNGNEEKAKALYVRMRLYEAKNTEQAAGQARSQDVPAQQSSSEIDKLRGRLAAALTASKRSSLYGALNLNPDCSDAEVSARIASVMKTSELSGSPLDAERRYAIGIIGNPESRESYDRKLMAGISVRPAQETSKTTSSAADVGMGGNSFLDSLGTGRLHTVITAGLLIIGGYYFFDQREKEVEKSRAALQQNKVQAVVAIENRRIDNQRFALEQGMHIGNRVVDQSTEERDRYLALQEERQRMEREKFEHRASIEAQRLELERQALADKNRFKEESIDRQSLKDEERRVNREKRYWSCMNNALNRYDSATAASRCSAYR